MVKLSGGSRKLQGGSKEYNKREKEFDDMMKSGEYSQGYFSEKGGGYYVVENSKAKHKPEELEAARYLADKGYKVTLKDEAGSIRTPDGKIFSASFEQSTPQGNSVNNFNKCLNHAKNKPGATAAVVYMKNGTHSKETIKKAIDSYSCHNKKQLEVYVVTKDGRIHRWRTHQ